VCVCERERERERESTHTHTKREVFTFKNFSGDEFYASQRVILNCSIV